MSLKRRGAFLCLLVLILNALLLNAQTRPQSGYHVVNQYKLGGEGGIT